MRRLGLAAERSNAADCCREYEEEGAPWAEALPEDATAPSTAAALVLVLARALAAASSTLLEGVGGGRLLGERCEGDEAAPVRRTCSVHTCCEL